MTSYFITITDDTNRQVKVNIAHIRYYFAEKHYGKDVTTITFDQGSVRVLESPESIAALIDAAQQS